jgi:hypothetical protein
MKGNAAQIAAGMSNLALLAEILEEVNRAHRGYRQACFVSDDQAGCCALGYWCAYKAIDWLDLCPEEVESDFALTAREAAELFAGSGCGEAESAAQASAYLRKFLARQREPRTSSTAPQVWRGSCQAASMAN